LVSALFPFVPSIPAFVPAIRAFVRARLRACIGRVTVAALTCLASPVQAELPDEIQVYADDINAPGQFHLELHLNTTPSGRSTPHYPGEITPAHGIRLTPEFSYGLTPDLEAGLYVPTERASGGSVYVAGAKLRMKWLGVHASGGGPFAGLNIELSQVAERFERDRRSMEMRPMLGWRSADWLIAFNPTLDIALAGPGKDQPPDFAPSLKVARTVTDWAALGLEYYTDLGPVSDILPYAQQGRTLYAAIDVERPPWVFNFGIGRGFGEASDAWTVKMIFEIPLD
jgi:hypothetical protein